MLRCVMCLLLHSTSWNYLRSDTPWITHGHRTHPGHQTSLPTELFLAPSSSANVLLLLLSISWHQVSSSTEYLLPSMPFGSWNSKRCTASIMLILYSGPSRSMILNEFWSPHRLSIPQRLLASHQGGGGSEPVNSKAIPFRAFQKVSGWFRKLHRLSDEIHINSRPFKAFRKVSEAFRGFTDS